MKLTPMEISGKRFKKRFRGADVEEVNEYLEMVSSELEELIRQNRYLEEELGRKNSDLTDFKSREQTLKDTLILAQKLARDMKNNMAKEAQIILSEAEIEAEKIVRSAHDRALGLEEEIRELRHERLKLIEELRSILNTHAKLLEVEEESARAKEAQEDKVQRIPASRAKTEA